MDWTIATVTFLATAVVLAALFFAFVPGELGIAARLDRRRRSATRNLPASRESVFAPRWPRSEK